jgi:hypothetical protein
MYTGGRPDVASPQCGSAGPRNAMLLLVGMASLVLAALGWYSFRLVTPTLGTDPRTALMNPVPVTPDPVTSAPVTTAPITAAPITSAPVEKAAPTGALTTAGTIPDWVQQLDSEKERRVFFSQNGEDGVTEYLLQHVPLADKFYFEFGTESGPNATRAFYANTMAGQDCSWMEPIPIHPLICTSR